VVEAVPGPAVAQPTGRRSRSSGGANTLQNRTGADGRIDFDLNPGDYNVKANAFGLELKNTNPVTLGDEDMEFPLPLALGFRMDAKNEKGEPVGGFRVGDIVTLEAIVDGGAANSHLWSLDNAELQEGDATKPTVHWDTIGAAGNQQLGVAVTFLDGAGAGVTTGRSFDVRDAPPTRIATFGALPVTLTRANIESTNDQALWSAIRTASNRISFRRYCEFINLVLCKPQQATFRSSAFNSGGIAKAARQFNELYEPVYGMGAYELLKTTTEIFLLLNSGVGFFDNDDDILNFDPQDEATRNGRFLPLVKVADNLAAYMNRTSQLPYIQRILAAAFPDCGESNAIFCGGFLENRANNTLLMELIWTYWHKLAMVSQSMKAISLRFQNRRRTDGPDPLAHLEIAPLLPLNNLLWGYIQDEPHRLSELRTAHELEHEYGLTHVFSNVRPVESRSKFRGAFHRLIIQALQFYRQDDDATVNADAFSLLNALREVHLLLAEGNHNQSFDLTVTSRAEMLMEMWMLARPELREFLQSRAMVPYREQWMGPVDTMKRLQGWTDVPASHFSELADYEEQVLLSVRYGDWVDVNNPAQAANWARSWRPELLSIAHSVYATTGVELRADLTPQQQRLLSAQPSVLINRRRPMGALPALLPGQAADGLPRFRERRTARRQLRP
jgi:hypothetical protein